MYSTINTDGTHFKFYKVIAVPVLQYESKKGIPTIEVTFR